MSARGIVAIVVGSVAAGVAAGYLAAPGGAPGAGEGEAGGAAPLVPVQVAPVVRRAVADEVPGYGSVQPIPGQSRAVTVSFECRVRRVLVTHGQTVEAGQPLVEVEPSADARLAAGEARADLDAARSTEAQVRERLDAQLATRGDLIEARQRLRQADLRVRSLRERRAEGTRVLVAPGAGTIGELPVLPGQVVPPGTPLAEILVGIEPEVRLGIEPADADRVRPGQAVRLERLDVGRRVVQGTVRLVAARRLSPDTRLVDVFVTPAPGAAVLLGEPVRGRVRTGEHDGLVVPRSALVPEGERFRIFTVEDGVARARDVDRAPSGDDEVEVTGEGLREGQSVVVVGAPELSDGMAVRTEAAP